MTKFGPSERTEIVRVIGPRDLKKESIYLIDKNDGFIRREYVDGELRYEIPWPPMWLSESELGELLIIKFWFDYLQNKGNYLQGIAPLTTEVLRGEERIQHYDQRNSLQGHLNGQVLSLW